MSFDELSVADFGAVPSYDHRNPAPLGPAFQAAKEAILSRRALNGGPNLRIPCGFWAAETIEINDIGFNLIGEGGGMAGGNATTLMFPPTGHGIIIGRSNTSGLEPKPGMSRPYGGDGTRIEDMRLMSTSRDDGTAFNGITLLARATIRNVMTDGWSQDGIQVVAPIAPGYGNANVFHIEGGRSWSNGRDGLHILGSDTNAGIVNGLDVSQNRRWGIRDRSFLGTTFLGCHSEANGWAFNGVTRTHARVFHNGFFWLLMLGHDAHGGTVEPGKNDDVWEPIFAGPAATADVPQWERGEVYETGGAYGVENVNARSLLLGCYSESGQPQSQLAANAMALGGMHAAGFSRNSLAFVDGTFTQGFIARRGPEDPAMEVGRDGSFMSFWHYAKMPHTNRLRMDRHGDMIWDISNSFPAFRVIQQNSPYVCGRSSAPEGGFLAGKLFIGERLVDTGYGPPTSAEGEFAQGDRRNNLATVPGGDVGWICVEGGVPGEWASMGKIPVTA